MPVFEIKSYRGALSDWEDKGTPGAFKFGSNLDVRKDIDSLTCNQALVDEGLDEGHSPSLSPSPSASLSYSPSLSPSGSVSNTPSPTASPSASPSTTPSPSVSASPSNTPSSSISFSPSPSAGLTTVFNDLIRFFVKCSDGYTYGFGSTGSIYRRDSDGFWMQVYKDPNGAIKGAEEKPSSTGKRWLYWATDLQLNRKEIPGLSNWNDVQTVANNLRSASWHTMKQIGGALKICNLDYLAFVGYDDSYTNEALDLIPGNYTKTLVERNGRVVIGTYKATDPNNGINSAIDAEYPIIQVGNDGYVYFADFSNSISIKRFPGGGKTNPGGVCNEVERPEMFDWEENALSWIDKQEIGNMALFAVYSTETGRGGIYSYGRRNKNKPFVMNLEYQFDADELGAIVNIDGTTLVSYRDGTDFGVKAVSNTIKATAIYEGIDLRAPIKGVSNITNWKNAEVFMKPLPANSSVSFYYKVNKTGDWIQAGNTYNSANGKKAVFPIVVDGEIFEPRVVLTPYLNTTPEIHRIRINFN
jgi:hypothetical protein